MFVEASCDEKETGQLWKIKKYKGSPTCVHKQQLYVMYISTMIEQLVKAEVSILVTMAKVPQVSIFMTALQAEVSLVFVRLYTNTRGG